MLVAEVAVSRIEMIRSHSQDAEGGVIMETAKEQYLVSKPNWEAVMELRELEKAGYSRLRILMEEGRYSESGQVLDVLRAVGII